MRQRCVCAWIQYSRRTPPGAGWICGTACAAAACGRRTPAAVALYRLQIELLGRPEARQVHEEWDASLRTLGEHVLASSRTITPDLDIRLVVAALDGLRLGVLIAGDTDVAWVRPAVQRQLRALLG